MLALDLADRDFPLLDPDETVQEALNKFRGAGLPYKIIYFYVADRSRRFLGVLPTRILLTADLQAPIRDIYIRKTIAMSRDTTFDEARKVFSEHKFLAFPIVDEENRILGVIDVERFLGNLGEIHQRTGFDDIYDLLGLPAGARGDVSIWTGFRMRFPWLIATIVAGSLSALLMSRFEATLREALVLAFFLAMVLGLNESVCMQSATLAVQRLHGRAPTLRGFFGALGNELLSGGMLGLATSVLVSAVVLAWRGPGPGAVAIGASLFLSICVSCGWGLAVPYLLRIIKKDPNVAAAPIALGLADLSTLLIYFSTARIILDSA